MAEKVKRGESEPLTVVDEPGMAERFQRGLQRALNTPAQHRTRVEAKSKRIAGVKPVDSLSKRKK
jgi:hypothetical protein